MSSSTVAGSSDHPVSSLSSFGSDKAPAAIFLSHSGRQKPFVENLFEALRQANQSAFFDRVNLPKGSPFPQKIKTAARDCKLGVVVLSDDYLTSKWPMLELEILVNQRGPEPKVLPLFYKLRPKDLKSSEKLAEWKQKWGQDAAKWEEALRTLRSFNGEIFDEGTTELKYIRRVVKSICREVPNPPLFDLSLIVGHHRLAKEVARHFDPVCSARPYMVGLHGVGGVGKTTLCKAMVNLFSSEYAGRSHHLELPTNGRDTKQIIVEKIKGALKALAILDDEPLSNANDIDQVIQLMKIHVSGFDVFLAIDNVWETSREGAERILRVGYSADSKILVTSRSEQVLKDMLRYCENSYLGPLPQPERREALKIFEQAAELVDLNSYATGRELCDRVLERCRFDSRNNASKRRRLTQSSGIYHPLALRAVGLHVRNACGLGDRRHTEENLQTICDNISKVDLTSLEDVIRLSYDNLQEIKKHFFLDMVMHWRRYHPTLEKAQQWLINVYDDDKLPEAKIIETMNGLFQDGLLQLGTVESTGGERKINVHDLYVDLAEKVAATSSRFFIEGKSSSNVEGIRWKELKRVYLRGKRVKDAETVQFIKMVQQQECPELQVLVAKDVKFSKGIDLRLMPSLRILQLESTFVKSIRKRSPASGLVTIDLRNVSLPVIKHLSRSSAWVLNLKKVNRLQVLAVRSVTFLESIEGLEALNNLQDLQVHGCGALKELDGLSGSLQLKSIGVSHSSIRGLPDLSRLTCLERLYLQGNKSMERVGRLSPTLKNIRIVGCSALKTLNLRGLTRLKRLVLRRNKAMEVVEGESVSNTPIALSIEECGRLRRFPKHFERLCSFEQYS